MTPEWTTVVLVILTWLMSAALTYGIVITKLGNLKELHDALEARVNTLESRQLGVIKCALTRDEFQRMHQQLEDKVDRNNEQLGNKIDGVRDFLNSWNRNS